MLEKVISQGLKATGRRMTRTRKAVLSLLERTHEPLSASEIFAQLQEDQVAIDLVTVYRTVNVLKDLGLVAQLDLHHEGQSRYELKEGRKTPSSYSVSGLWENCGFTLMPLKEIDEID